MKVIIVGALCCSELDLRRCARKFYGMTDDELVLFKDYNKIKDCNFTAFRNHPEISDVIFGQIPHSCGSHGQYASMMQKMRCEPGYPHVIQVRNMRLTISSFKSAMNDSVFVKSRKKEIVF